MCKRTLTGYQLSDNTLIPYSTPTELIQPEHLAELNREPATIVEMMKVRESLHSFSNKISAEIMKISINVDDKFSELSTELKQEVKDLKSTILEHNTSCPINTEKINLAIDSKLKRKFDSYENEHIRVQTKDDAVFYMQRKEFEEKGILAINKFTKQEAEKEETEKDKEKKKKLLQFIRENTQFIFYVLLAIMQIVVIVITLHNTK